MASGWEVSGAAPPLLSAYTHCGCLVSVMTSIMERACVPWTAPLPSMFTRRLAGYQCYKSEVMLGDLFHGLVRHSNHHRICTVAQVLQYQFADRRHRAGAQRVSLLPVGDLAGEGSAQ